MINREDIMPERAYLKAKCNAGTAVFCGFAACVAERCIFEMQQMQRGPDRAGPDATNATAKCNAETAENRAPPPHAARRMQRMQREMRVASATYENATPVAHVPVICNAEMQRGNGGKPPLTAHSRTGNATNATVCLACARVDSSSLGGVYLKHPPPEKQFFQIENEARANAAHASSACTLTGAALARSAPIETRRGGA